MPEQRESTIIVTEEEMVFSGEYISVVARRFLNKRDGGKGLWECVKRKTHGRIVAVAAFTADREIILTKTYRVPAQAWVIELCAGLMDKSGESEVEVAGRELLEETGYTATILPAPLFQGAFNAGLLEDQMAVYMGLNSIKVIEPRLETGEDIEVLRIPLDKADHFLHNPPPKVVVDIKIFGVVNDPRVKSLMNM